MVQAGQWRAIRGVFSAVLCASGFAWSVAYGVEFRATTEPAVVLYDGPSLKSKKLFIVNRDYPLEVLVQLEGWTKVRDALGVISWTEGKSLERARMVLLKSAQIVRQEPREDAIGVFHGQRDLLLEFVATATGGWVQVKHRDGAVGYLRSTDLWGVPR